jgi:hypothetical protein
VAYVGRRATALGAAAVLLAGCGSGTHAAGTTRTTSTVSLDTSGGIQLVYERTTTTRQTSTASLSPATQREVNECLEQSAATHHPETRQECERDVARLGGAGQETEATRRINEAENRVNNRIRQLELSESQRAEAQREEQCARLYREYQEGGGGEAPSSSPAAAAIREYGQLGCH